MHTGAERERGLKYLVTGSRVFASISDERQRERVGARVGKERERVQFVCVPWREAHSQYPGFQ